MPRRSKKRKAKQILVTKEKLQQLEQAKQEEVKTEPVKQKITRGNTKNVVDTEIKNAEIRDGKTFIETNVGTVVINPNTKVPFVDMLGEILEIGDNVVYVSSHKGKVLTKIGKISDFMNKKIVVLTEDKELIKVRNVIKLEVTKKIVRKVVKQEIKKLSILEYIKGMFIKK